MYRKLQPWQLGLAMTAFEVIQEVRKLVMNLPKIHCKACEDGVRSEVESTWLLLNPRQVVHGLHTDCNLKTALYQTNAAYQLSAEDKDLLKFLELEHLVVTPEKQNELADQILTILVSDETTMRTFSLTGPQSKYTAAKKDAEKQAKAAKKDAEKQAKAAKKDAEKQAKAAEKDAAKQAKAAEAEANSVQKTNQGKAGQSTKTAMTNASQGEAPAPAPAPAPLRRKQSYPCSNRRLIASSLAPSGRLTRRPGNLHDFALESDDIGVEPAAAVRKTKKPAQSFSDSADNQHKNLTSPPRSRRADSQDPEAETVQGSLSSSSSLSSATSAAASTTATDTVDDAESDVLPDVIAEATQPLPSGSSEYSCRGAEGNPHFKAAAGLPRKQGLSESGMAFRPVFSSSCGS